MQRAFYAIPLPPTAKLIGLTLAWHHNAESGRCDPSVLLLAKETCVCERSISMALKTLEADGHITIIRRTGQHNHYLLHPRSKCGTASDAPPQEMRETPAANAVPPPQQMRYTPAADAAKLEVTGRVNRKEPESFASAAANAGGSDSLFPIEPPQPKPPKERKPKPETELDPRQTPIIQKLADVYQTAMGEKLCMDAADWSRTQSGLKKLLPLIPDADKDDILTNWYNVLVISKNGSHVPALVHTATRPFNFLNKKNYDVVNRMVVDVSQRQPRGRRNDANHEPNPNSEYGF
jgi:hypothetical protein